jgi:hypothetical protein
MIYFVDSTQASLKQKFISVFKKYPSKQTWAFEIDFILI